MHRSGSEGVQAQSQQKWGCCLQTQHALQTIQTSKHMHEASGPAGLTGGCCPTDEQARDSEHQSIGCRHVIPWLEGEPLQNI